MTTPLNEGTVPAAVPADLLDALSSFLEAQDALDNHELAGINAEPYFVLMRRRNSARRDLDAALATSAPPSPAGMPASEYLAKVEANPRRAAALQRARERATSAPPPVEAREPSGIRYTSWCDKHSRAIPCDRCAATHPKEPTEPREASAAAGLQGCASIDACEHASPLYCMKNGCRNASPGMVEEPSSKEPTEARGDGVKGTEGQQ